MNRLVLAAIAALLAPAFAGCITPPPVETADIVAPDAGLDADGYLPKLATGILFETFQTTAAGGIRVHAEVFRPDPATAVAGAELPEKVPTILVHSPYRGAGYQGRIPTTGMFGWLVQDFVPRGYAVVFGDNVGNGGSGGCWDFMGPREQAGSHAIVQGIAEQPWSDGKVGMIGVSYDGMTQIMAAAGAPDALVTVVPIAALTHAYAGLYMNGVHYGGGWMATTTFYTQGSVAPPGASTDRYPGYVERLAGTPPCAADNTVMGNDPTGAYNAYFQARDFRPKAADVKASVFLVQGFLDGNVKPDNAFPWYTDVTTPKKAWLGHWWHQFPNAAATGREDGYVTIHRWFDHWLKDADNGMADELHVDVQDSIGRWRREATWPPADAEARVLYLDGGALKAEPAAAGAASFGGPAAALPAPYRDMQGGVATFRGEALAQPMLIAGMPHLDATLSSNRPGGQIIARLYDESSDGSRRLISHGAFNLLLARGPNSAQPLTPDAAVTIGFDFYPTDYLVEAGHTLVLTLTTMDFAVSWYNPDPWAATLRATLGGEEGTRLTLPIVMRTDTDVLLVACGLPVQREGYADCYDKSRKDQGVGS